jgi:hypothetical protein
MFPMNVFSSCLSSKHTTLKTVGYKNMISFTQQDKRGNSILILLRFSIPVSGDCLKWSTGERKWSDGVLDKK